MKNTLTKHSCKVQCRAMLIVVVSSLILLSIIGCDKSSNNKDKASASTTRSTIVDTLVATLDLPDLVKNSDLIIRGKVVNVQPSYEGPASVVIRGEKAAEEFEKKNPGVEFFVISEDVSDEEFSKTERWAEENRRIFTDFQIKVNKIYLNDKKIKTEKNETFVVQEFGGQVGDRNLVEENVDLLNLGDDVILFLRRNPMKGYEDTYQILTYQGKYKIKGDIAENLNKSKSKGVSDLEKEISEQVLQKSP